MLAQRLRHQVALQSQSTSLDAYGGNVGAWSTVATVRAGIEPIGGTEAARNGQNAAEQMVRVVLRYRSGVTPQMRIVRGSTIYTIVAVANRDEANRMLELTCKTGGGES